MDISNINSNYLSQAVTDANKSTAAAKSAAGRDYAGATDEEMLDACKKFEAYFIEQVLKEVQKTIPETEYSDNATGTLVNFFKDNMVQDIAENVQDTAKLGLAQQMYEQMKRTYGERITPEQIEESRNKGEE